MFNTAWFERKFADQLFSRVERFRVISNSPYKANFRCDLCGDSKKSKTKARAYVYEGDGKLWFRCHNCGESYTFGTYLKLQHSSLFSEYVFEVMQNKSANSQPEYKPSIDKTPIKRFEKFEPLKQLTKISALPDTNIARKYVLSRKIPTHYHYKLFYCPKFFTWVNEYIPNKFSEKAIKYDGPRLVIPFIDQAGYCFGAQGRSLSPDADIARYITILFDETKPKCFGLDTVDFSKKVYILEGAIDSMFLKNALAFNGIDGDPSAYVKGQKPVLVLDNEPRNLEVLNKYSAYIAQGHNIVIWPSYIEEKDINLMILGGQSPEQIQSVIDSHTYSGMGAQLAFNNWRRV